MFHRIARAGYFFSGLRFVRFTLILLLLSSGCINNLPRPNLSPGQILGNPEYLAISYGGYRTSTRADQPSIKEIQEDLKILSALGIKILRTYNVHLPHAHNVLKAIRLLKKEDPDFEMYVMLGAWINCLHAFTDVSPNHEIESPENKDEIYKAVELANEFDDIVKIIAVGNEAMIKWAEAYYVQPGIILKWVTFLQDLKKEGKLSKDIWITSSDNFASWGGGSSEYHTQDLYALIEAVDYISMHTYPMHDTHYNPEFWYQKNENADLEDSILVYNGMSSALDYAQSQYYNVKNYMISLGFNKPVHIGETGWASYCNGFYGKEGSRACDELKQKLYYDLVREWTSKDSITCFFFEAFDESWKDAANPEGSENHFGLFNVDGKAKLAIWDEVDLNKFDNLTRGPYKIEKTFNGNIDSIMKQVYPPPFVDKKK